MAVAASLDLDGNTPAPILVEAAVTEGLLPKALKGASRVALSDADLEAAQLLGRTEAEFLEGKRLVALSENPSCVAALSDAGKEAARLLGLSEVE